MIVVRILAKVAAGAFIGGVLGYFFTGGDWMYTIVWAVAIPAFILLGLLGGSRRVTSSFPGFALARVETAQRGAVAADGRQEVTLRLVVAPPRSAAYSTTTTITIPTDDMWLYNSGSVLVVARANDNRPDVTIVSAPPAEWVARADQARADASLIPVASAAPAWEPATTTTPGTPRPGGAGLLSGFRGSDLMVSLLIIAATAAIVLIPAYGSIGRTFSDLAAGRPDGANMVTGIHQQDAVDAIAAVAGSYQFTDLSFYDSYVLADGLTAPGAMTTDSYMWRWGRAMRDGPSFIQPSDLQAELFDASGLDFSIIGSLVAEAKEAANLDNIDSVYVGVRRSIFDENSQVPEINISINNAYFDARFTYDFDGNELSRDGSAFDR